MEQPDDPTATRAQMTCPSCKADHELADSFASMGMHWYAARLASLGL